MGQLNSKSICGGGQNVTEQERNHSEIYLPSNYYPYHINHFQNSEYHPRTYNTDFIQETEQMEYNSSRGRQPLQQNSKYYHNFQESSHINQQYYSKSPTRSNLKQTNRNFNDQNLDRTMQQTYNSNSKDTSSPYNYNSMANLTYITPFQMSSNSKIQTAYQTNNYENAQISNSQTKSYAYRIQKLSELVTFAPVLRLTVLASINLKKDQILTINAQGLLSGLRNDRDGYVFFGCKKKPKRMNKLVKQTQIINDFIIPPTDPQQAKQQRGRHFQIRYDIKNNFYTIVDLGVGFGVFKKLTIPHLLCNHDLINFGLTLCTIKFITKENPNKSFSQKNFEKKEDIILKAQFFGGYSNGEVYELDPKEYQEITIGRSDNCSLSFKDKLISKIQCLLTFKPNHGWILKDGDGNIPSTNGTWIYFQKEEQIVDGMIIKANQTVFQASIH